MNRVAIALGMTVAATLASRNASAEADKLKYELQERCGQTALAAFNRDNPGQGIASYENHYNLRLNKCFVLYTTTFFNSKTTNLSLTIFDVNENKEYGEYFGTQDSQRQHPLATLYCTVRDILCHSEDEWRQLTKSYMEE
jgi:hypothetical protein